jgi:hypothetical protein
MLLRRGFRLRVQYIYCIPSNSTCSDNKKWCGFTIFRYLDAFEKKKRNNAQYEPTKLAHRAVIISHGP